MEKYDLIIIGGGCAGYPASVYASRYNLKTLVIAKELGGLIATTKEVENFPGFNSIGGFELAQKLEEQAKFNNVPILNDTVKSIEKQNNTYVIKTDLKEEIFETKTILLATGTKHRHLGIESESQFKGKGVSYCATCDGMFFRNKIVGVVGGGDSAIKDAIVLAQHSSKVYIFVRSKLRAEPANIKQLDKFDNIEIITGVNIKEIKGDNLVKSVDLDNGKNIELNGLFIAIGLIPQSELTKKIQVKTNEFGEIIVDRDSKTNQKGVYAAGDVTDNSWKQAIMASAQGSMAAHSAYEYIQKEFK